MTTNIRQIQKEHTRRALIAAALVVFARDGLAEAKTSDIAAVAKVSHGAVFAHFSTRDALLAAAIEEFGGRVAARLHELVEGGGGLREVLQAHVEGLAEFEPFYARLVTQGTVLPREAQTAMIVIQSAVSLHLSQAATRGMEEGTTRRMPLHLLFNTWIGLLHYYIANADMFAPGESVLRHSGPELVVHFTRLVSADESSTKEKR